VRSTTFTERCDVAALIAATVRDGGDFLRYLHGQDYSDKDGRAILLVALADLQRGNFERAKTTTICEPLASAGEMALQGRVDELEDLLEKIQQTTENIKTGGPEAAYVEQNLEWIYGRCTAVLEGRETVGGA
jgi:hypothetical protein